MEDSARPSLRPTPASSSSPGSAAPARTRATNVPVVTTGRGWAARLVETGRSTFEAIDPALSPRFLFGSIGGLLLGVIALTIYVRSGDTLQPVKVRLRGPVMAASVPSTARVRIVVAPVWSSHEAFAPYEALARYLGERLRTPVVVAQRRTQGEVADLLAAGHVQAGVLSEGAYLHLRAHAAAVDALVVPVTHGQPRHESLMIVAANSKLYSLPDLRGHSFAFTDPYSLTGYYEPLDAVLPLAGACAGFFSRTIFSYADEDSMRAVRDGSVDAAAVSSHVFEQELDKTPGWLGSLRVIRSSADYGRGPLVVPATLDPALRNSLRSAFVQMHEQADGRAVLAALHIERFIEPPPGLYDSAAAIIEQVEAAPKVRP